MFDLAEFLLQVGQFLRRERAIGFIHKSGISLEKTLGCA
jgi:hypothetical protein